MKKKQKEKKGHSNKGLGFLISLIILAIVIYIVQQLPYEESNTWILMISIVSGLVSGFVVYYMQNYLKW